jgi:hypothetical protein
MSDPGLLEITHDKDAKKIVWRWAPDKAFHAKMRKLYPYISVADGYVVVENPKAEFGIVVYANHHGEWGADSHSLKPVILRMMEEMSGMNPDGPGS